jgi:hypothetical protein
VSAGTGIPTLREIARRALPQALEASVVPALLLLLVRNAADDTVAIGAALAWIVAATAWHGVRGRPVTGLTMLAITRLLVRSVVAIAAGSIFVYFVQGSLGGFCLAAAFLVSVVIDRPFARRFADDFCDLPARLLDRRDVHRALRGISLTWGVVGLAHALFGLWLLTNLSTDNYLVVNTFVSGAVPITLIAISVTWFRRAVTPRAIGERCTEKA